MILDAPKVAIQLVTYWTPSGQKDIERCLKALERLRYPKDRWALVIVDNPSLQGSASEYIQKEWFPKIGASLPEIFFVKNEENTGFAGGHSRAYDEAKKWGADMVYLLNQDAVIERNALNQVVKYSIANPDAALVQSRIMLFDRPELLNSHGNCLHFLGQGYADGNGQRPADIKSNRPKFYASGAAVLVKTSVVDEIGGLFDPRYFMYHEDVDLSWRARLAGHEIGYAKDSIVYHRYEFSRSMDKFFWMERNRFITHFAHLKLATLALIAVPMLISELASLIFATKNGWLKKKLEAYKALTSPETRAMIQERRALSKSIRKVPDREILKQMAGSIHAQEISHPVIEYVANPVLGAYHKVLKAVVVW